MALDKKFAAAGTTKAEARIEQAKGSKPVLIATSCVIDEIKQMLGRFLRVNTPFLGETKVIVFLKSPTYDPTQTGQVAGSIWWAPFQKLLRNGGSASASSSIEAPRMSYGNQETTYGDF
jgi:hypothetical protein